MNLPPYNPSAKCVKCGGEEVSTAWHQRGKCSRVDTSAFSNVGLKFCDNAKGPCADIAEDHLLRDCSNCGYEWLERPLDGLPDKSGPQDKIDVLGVEVRTPEWTEALITCTNMSDEKARWLAAKIEELLASNGWSPVSGKPKYAVNTAERVVEILNENFFRGHSDWFINGEDSIANGDCGGADNGWFSIFEAEAIAEKYAKDGK